MFQNSAPSGSICLLVLLVPFHSAQRHTSTAIRQDRTERSIETIPSFDQLFLAIENHWKQWWNDPKTIDVNGQRPKNIQWWWFPQKPLEICNGLFKTIEIYNYCKSKCWETFSLLYCVIFTLWNDVRSQYIWSISNGFYGSWFTWYAKKLYFVVNWF